MRTNLMRSTLAVAALLLALPLCAQQTINGGNIKSNTIPTAAYANGSVTDAKASLLVKPAVAVVAVANLTLSGEQTIDGNLTSASLVLATAQSAGAENGPWVTAAGAWARPTWYTTGSTTQAPRYLTTFVRLGTVYSGSTWRMTTASVTIGTTATTWVQTPLALGTTSVSGTLPAAQLPALSGDISTSAGSATTTIGASKVTSSMIVDGTVALADQVNAAANSIRCNNTGSAATPLDCTLAQTRTLLNLGVSGTYTPTATTNLNTDSTPVPGVATYVRVNDIVLVFGTVTVDATTTLTLTDFKLSLPIASTLAAVGDCVGMGERISTAETMMVYANTTNGTAGVRLFPTLVTSGVYYYIYAYRVI